MTIITITKFWRSGGVGQSRIGLPAFPKRFQKSAGSTAIYFAINLGYRKYKLRVAGLPAAKRPFWSIRPQLFWRLLVCKTISTDLR